MDIITCLHVHMLTCLQITPKSRKGIKIMVADNYIVNELAKFLRNETIEECPINIVSRKDIEGDNAELVRFTFGECDESCVAVVYEDGTVYTPCDWQTPVWDEEGWKISDTESWMDCYFRPCFMFNDMPIIIFGVTPWEDELSQLPIPEGVGL